MRQSLSAPGQRWDNAVAESFWATIKEELVHRHPWPTRVRARQAIFEFIEVFYNRQAAALQPGLPEPSRVRGPSARAERNGRCRIIKCVRQIGVSARSPRAGGGPCWWS